MNVLYFIWVSDKNALLANRTITNQSVYTSCKELGVSILSLKEHSPNVNVNVCIANKNKESLNFIISFLEKNNCNIKYYDIEDNNTSLFTKFIFLRKVLDDFDSFLFLDLDTLIIKDIAKLPKPKTIYFTVYEKFPSGKHKLNKKQYRFLVKYFDIKKKFEYVNTYIMNITQNNENNKFWNLYKEEMDKIICKFKKRCNGIHTDELNLNDEIYCTLAMLNSGYKPICADFRKTYKIIKHGKRFYRSPTRIKYEKNIRF